MPAIKALFATFTFNLDWLDNPRNSIISIAFVIAGGVHPRIMGRLLCWPNQILAPGTLVAALVLDAMRYHSVGMRVTQILEPLADQNRNSENDDFRHLRMLLVLLQDRQRIAIITLVSFLIGAVVAFSMKVTFTAIATILPPQAPQSTASALMGQLGSLAGLGAGGAGGLLKNPADIYVAMLESRTIADHIINKFHLSSLWKQKKLEDTHKTLKAHTEFEAAKDGLIVITVKDPNPKLASDMANAFVDELYRMNSTLAVTEAGQRRLFFDQQHDEEKNALAAAENDLRATQEKTGLIELTGQSEMAIRTIAETAAELRSREVELEAMRSYATDQNPDLNRLQSQIDVLRQQLSTLENNQKGILPGDTQVPAGRVPKEGLEYIRKLREVKYHQTLYDLLSRQFEAARIDEAKSAPIIQVIDHAVPPDKKSGPPRMLIVLGFGVIGFCFACLWAFGSQALARMRQDHTSAGMLDQISTILHIRL
jgi:tyrosine-protein kinase Etk/Wzc